MSRCVFATALAVGLVGASAQAGSIVIDRIGGGITLNSGPLSGTVFGNDSPGWSSASLMSVHASITASGIATDNKVTFAAADTDHGLAFLTLIDQELGGITEDFSGNMHMVTTADGTNVDYINDMGEGFLVSPQSSSSRVAFGDFHWDNSKKGDGWAWADLQGGDVLTFRFKTIQNMDLGLDASATFQFVTWNGTGWDLIATPAAESSFTAGDEFGFSGVVSVPLPHAAMLAGLPLLGTALWRRRTMVR